MKPCLEPRISLVLASLACIGLRRPLHKMQGLLQSCPFLESNEALNLAGSDVTFHPRMLLASLLLAPKPAAVYKAPCKGCDGFLGVSKPGQMATSFHSITPSATRNALNRHRLTQARMALGVLDDFPPTILKELTSILAQKQGKRVVIFFSDADNACSKELQALDDVGGELYLRACEIVVVRNPNAASADSPTRYAFLEFAEDRRDRIRNDLGIADMQVSYVVDATGTVISICKNPTEPGQHASNAMQVTRNFGWDREAGWERDFGGQSTAELPTTAERQAADLEKREILLKALRVPSERPQDKSTLQYMIDELFSTGIFEKVPDPDDLGPNPIGDNLARWSAQIQRNAEFARRKLEDDVLDAIDAAKDAAGIEEGAKSKESTE